MFNVSNEPVFTTEEAGGHMLVTENPNYIRKDLPAYIPQFFVLYKICNPSWKLYEDLCKIMKDFPIEKLQAMIDK